MKIVKGTFWEAALVAGLVLTAGLIAAGQAAQAKLTPFERQPRSSTTNVFAAMYLGPIGAMLERDYFQAPQPKSAQQIFPCTAHVVVFVKTRLAQACY